MFTSRAAHPGVDHTLRMSLMYGPLRLEVQNGLQSQWSGLAGPPDLNYGGGEGAEQQVPESKRAL